MFKKIREAHPSLPVIMMTSMSMERCFDNRNRRRDIIYRTYKNAVDGAVSSRVIRSDLQSRLEVLKNYI